MQPNKITVSKDRRSLHISFPQTDALDFSAEMLRVLSPSAEVQGHSPDQKKTISGKREVEIMQIEPVGNYAVRITFDDMHNTGIYTWDFFINLGNRKQSCWEDYLKELELKNLSRDR